METSKETEKVALIENENEMDPEPFNEFGINEEKKIVQLENFSKIKNEFRFMIFFKKESSKGSFKEIYFSKLKEILHLIISKLLASLSQYGMSF